jgi:hypothetical protein
MRKVVIWIIIVLGALIGAAAGARAQERFALVMANSDYERIGALPNPAHDAKAVAEMLKSAGFEVTSAVNLGQADMRRAVRDFADSLADKGEDSVALVFYAGHGVQVDGENYLLPVDANITGESDVPLEGVRLSDIMNLLDAAPSKTRIVAIDACRSNPFGGGETKAARGLAIVSAPVGTVVAYSTSPGAMAADGEGDNSPFTTALIEAAKKPGAPLESVLQNVRLTVHKATKGKQTPWEVTALTEPFYFFPGDGTQEIEPVAERSEDEWRADLQTRSPREAYDLVIQQNTVIVYQIFLAVFPDSSWARRIRAIMDQQVMMLAWFDALTLNSEAAFKAFLARYPHSDLVATAERLQRRAHTRALAANSTPGALGIAATPEVKTVIKEVKVPVVKVKEVIREVPVVKEVEVPGPVRIKEVVREVKVPVVKTVVKEVPGPVRVKTVVKEVKVPVVKTVVKTVKVPVIKYKTKTVVKTVVKKVPVIKVKTVRVPCKGGGGGHSSTSTIKSFNSMVRRIR